MNWPGAECVRCLVEFGLSVRMNVLDDSLSELRHHLSPLTYLCIVLGLFGSSDKWRSLIER